MQQTQQTQQLQQTQQIQSLQAEAANLRFSAQMSYTNEISAKAHVRKLLASGKALSIDAMCALSNKTAGAILTALSDLQSTKYAAGSVFKTHCIKCNDGIVRYSKA